MATLRKFLTVVGNQIQRIQDGSGEFLDPRLAPEVEEFTNDNAGTINIGQPVYVKANGNIDLAQADAASTSKVAGLVFDSSIASAAAGHVQVDGVVVATTGEWDAVTGGSGGLTPGALYFLSAASAGQLTTTAPSSTSQVWRLVGLALSSTEMKLLDTVSVLL